MEREGRGCIRLRFARGEGNARRGEKVYGMGEGRGWVVGNRTWTLSMTCC